MARKKEDDDNKKKGKKGSVVKVSQPISRAGMPTHNSRADYLNSHNQMVSPTQMLPPANEQQEDNGASNNMYNNGGFNGLVNAQGLMQAEPMAANTIWRMGCFLKFLSLKLNNNISF